MTLYLSPQLNFEWNKRMSTQHSVHDPSHGEIVHQSYSLPWPLKSRELLMKCSHTVSRPFAYAKCRSVRSDLVPMTPEMVRMEILESKWIFESLPNERTRVSVELEVSDKFATGVPFCVVDFVQKNSLKESVRNFEAANRRLRLPPHPTFISWHRSRDQLRKQTQLRMSRQSEHSGDLSSPWPEASATCVALSVLLALALACAASAACDQRDPRQRQAWLPALPAGLRHRLLRCSASSAAHISYVYRSGVSYVAFAVTAVGVGGRAREKKAWWRQVRRAAEPGRAAEAWKKWGWPEARGSVSGAVKGQLTDGMARSCSASSLGLTTGSLGLVEGQGSAASGLALLLTAESSGTTRFKGRSRSANSLELRKLSMSTSALERCC